MRSNISRALTILWEKSKDRLTEKEASDIAYLGELATMMSDHMTDVTDGIACLVMNDDNGCGSFRDRDSLSALLCSISAHTDVINGLLHISSEARHVAAGAAPWAKQ